MTLIYHYTITGQKEATPSVADRQYVTSGGGRPDLFIAQERGTNEEGAKEKVA